MPVKVSSPEAVRFLLEGSLALAEVEKSGVRLDMAYLKRTHRTLTKRVVRLERRMQKSTEWKLWQKTFRHRANMGSRDQLSRLLFGKMGYKPREYTAASYDAYGNLRADARGKVDKSALDLIVDENPFVADFVKAEQLKKTLSTYIEGLLREAVEHADGESYIHPIHNLNSAATYRSSEQLPNLQNQPRRNEEQSNYVRKGFLPHPGHYMADFDFGTLEVRIGYCMHKDPVMKKYLEDESTDMHRDAASDLFVMPVKFLAENKDWAKKTVRDLAKNRFVFSEFYGSVYFQNAKLMWEDMIRKKWDMPDGRGTVRGHLERHGIKSLGRCDPQHEPVKGTFEHHVKEVEKRLWQRFQVYARWKKDYYREYMERGYFEYPTGFVVHTNHKRNDVVNYPIQGSAFHCLLWCIIQMTKWLRKHRMKSRVINQIHDSVSLSIHPAELQDVIRKMYHLMTVALQKAWSWIITPMKAEVEVAGIDCSWAEQRQWLPKEDGTWAAKA